MKRSWLFSCFLLFTLFLSSCTTALSSVQSYVDTKDGYQFFYPSGWIQVATSKSAQGVDVIFRDLVEQTENLSVVINPIPNEQTLENLGTASEVGYHFLQQVNANSALNREVELINAQRYESEGKIYYNLEYDVKSSDQENRHDLARIVINRGKLYTFDLSTPQTRWSTVKPLFEKVLQSFQVY